MNTLLSLQIKHTAGNCKREFEPHKKYHLYCLRQNCVLCLAGLHLQIVCPTKKNTVRTVLFKTALECATVRAVCFRIVFNLHACFAPIPYAANCVCLKKHQHHILQIVPIWKKNTVYPVYFKFSSASTMQAVYSLWDYVPLKKYRTYGIFPHFFVHEYAAIVSTSKKNTKHTVHVHKIPYIRYFLTFFFCARVCWNCVHLKEKYRTYGTCP